MGYTGKMTFIRVLSQHSDYVQSMLRVEAFRRGLVQL